MDCIYFTFLNTLVIQVFRCSAEYLMPFYVSFKVDSVVIANCAIKIVNKKIG